MIATAFIDGKAYDTFRAPTETLCPFGGSHFRMGYELTVGNVWTEAHNWAYFDPTKAEVWARIFIDADAPWWTIKCNRRRDARGYGLYNQWPGSLCDPHSADFPDWLVHSPRLIERELIIHLAQRKHNGLYSRATSAQHQLGI